MNDLQLAEEALTPAARVRFDEVTADTLAKIQFTSGSTNLPKGPNVTQGTFANPDATQDAFEAHVIVVDG